MKILDAVLKVCGLLLACAFVYVCYEEAQNGRYVFLDGDNDTKLLDTRTGNYYNAVVSSEGLKLIRFNMVTGDMGQVKTTVGGKLPIPTKK